MAFNIKDFLTGLAVKRKSTTDGVNGEVTHQIIDGTVAVSGPVTNTELRASAVPVSGPMTDAQMRASAVPVSGPLTDAQMRATPVSTQPPATSAYGTGTREYAAVQRQSVSAASASFTIGTLGTSREILLHASTRCFVLTGASGSVTAAPGTGVPLAADEKFHLRVPTSHTHFAVIRDTADGFITLAAVA